MRKRTLLAGLMALLLGPSAWSLELNAVTVDELTTIGVSHDLAERLVDYRETHGDFLSSGDALKVQGMTQGQLNPLRSTLTIDGPARDHALGHGPRRSRGLAGCTGAQGDPACGPTPCKGVRSS